MVPVFSSLTSNNTYSTSESSNGKRKGEPLEGKSKKVCSEVFKHFNYQPLLDPKETPYNLSLPIDLSKIDPISFLSLAEIATTKYENNLPHLIALVEGNEKKKREITKRVQNLYDGCNFAIWRQSYPNAGIPDWVEPTKIEYFISYDSQSKYYNFLEEEFISEEKELIRPHTDFFNLIIAANNEDYQSQYELAMHYAKAEGLGKKRGLEEAFRYLKNCAETPYKLARHYAKAEGLDKERSLYKAFQYLKNCAKKPEVDETEIPETAEAEIPETAEAETCKIRELEKIHNVAMLQFANCYYWGIGVTANPAKAFEWYEKSAERGNFEAMNNLGHCFEEGIGVEKDAAKTFKWYEKSVEGGLPCGMLNLGNCFHDGIGVEKDFSQAFKWFKMSAERGNSMAMISLGYYFRKGKGVEKDLVQAFKWYEKGVEHGDSCAKTYLAVCLLENFDGLQNCEGVPKNKAESEKLAVRWLEEASKSNAIANYFLGLCYLYGYGVEVNLEQGKQLLMMGYQASPSMLEIMYNLKSLSESHPGLFTENENPQNYTQLYNDLIKKTSPDKIQDFIEILRLGKRIPQNIPEANRLDSILHGGTSEYRLQKLLKPLVLQVRAVLNRLCNLHGN